MGDAMEGAAGDVEEEADATYEEVLASIGLDLVGGQAVPTTKLKGKVEEKTDISDLEKQLKELKG